MQNRVPLLICLLVTMAMMWPSEGAIHGDGLHLAFLWTVVAIVAVWTEPALSLVRNRTVRQMDIGKLAMYLLVAGFCFSTWHVFQVPGDRRSALNLAMEWTAIGIGYWLVWKMTSVPNFRRTVIILLISLGFGAGALGMAQHHLMYERRANWYQ